MISRKWAESLIAFRHGPLSMEVQIKCWDSMFIPVVIGWFDLISPDYLEERNLNGISLPDFRVGHKSRHDRMEAYVHIAKVQNHIFQSEPRHRHCFIMSCRDSSTIHCRRCSAVS